MTDTSLVRRLTTILALDVVAFSTMSSRMLWPCWPPVWIRRARSCASIADAVFKMTGDALLAEFASPVEAVRAALEIQEAMCSANAGAEADDLLVLRIGVNLGNVVESGDDLLGDAVNVAVRLESISAPGGICISSSVYEQIVGKLMLGAEDIGEQHVKNMPRPVHAYRLTVAGPRPGAAAHPAHAMARSMPRTRLLLAGGATTVLVLAALAGTFHVRHPSAPRSLQTARTYVRPAGCACARAGYRRAPVPSPRHSLGRICAPAVPRAAPQPPPAPRRFAARDVPFVPDFHWRALQNYADAPGAKALALNVLGIFATATDRLDEAAARRTTVEDCNRKVERHVPVVHAYDGCTLYAVENDVVWSFRSPPMPPPPCAFNEAVAAGHPGSCDGAVATPGSARAVDRPLPHQPTQSRAYTRTQSLRLVDTERRRRRRDPPQPADLQPSYGTALRRVRTE